MDSPTADCLSSRSRMAYISPPGGYRDFAKEMVEASGPLVGEKASIISNDCRSGAGTVPKRARLDSGSPAA